MATRGVVQLWGEAMEYRPKLEPFEPVLQSNKGPIIRDLLVVDDHPLMCEALSMTLSTAFGLKQVRSAASLAEAKADIRANGAPDAVVLDLSLPDVTGIEGVVAVKVWAPDTLLTVISAEIQADMIGRIISAGACGYIGKSLPRLEMVNAMQRMWAGETVLPEGYEDAGAGDHEIAALTRMFCSLTPQQMNILQLICQGHPNKIISYKLSIAEATVKTHIAAIMTKINVRNRTQAALLASKARLFSS